MASHLANSQQCVQMIQVSASFPDVVITKATIGVDLYVPHRKWHGELAAMAIFDQYLDDTQALQLAAAFGADALCSLPIGGTHLSYHCLHCI